MRGIAELALTAEADLATCREALADCVEEADRVRTLLDTLMDISEAETGTLSLDLDVVQLAALLEDAVDLYREVADDKGITVSSSAPPELCLRADRPRLRQVLANLLDNALKYTAPGGTVALSASERPSQVVITVEDSGMGIPPEASPHLGPAVPGGPQPLAARPGVGFERGESRCPGAPRVCRGVQSARPRLSLHPDPSHARSLRRFTSPAEWYTPFTDVMFR